MKSLLITAVCFYIITGLYLFTVQRSFIYFPVKETLSHLPSLIYRNNDHAIGVTVLNKQKNRAILYFGGNAENVEYNADSFLKLLPNYTIYLFKYRGYGGSAGTPSEKGIYSDALYVYDAIKTNHDEVSLIGRSLGTGVATYVAANRDVEKLVLVTPFDSIQSVAQSRFPIYPMSILLKDKYDSLSRAKAIQAETLIIAAENDTIIKMSHTKRLIEAFEGGAAFHTIEGAGHNDLSNYPFYNKLLTDFFRVGP